MASRGWEPEVVFVPKGLSVKQWDALLTGHAVDGDLSKYDDYSNNPWLNTSRIDNSFIHTRTPNDDYVVIETENSDQGGSWDLAVISATPGAEFVNVSPDGAHGPNARDVLKSLLTFFRDTGRSAPASTAELISQLSPSSQVLQALQLSLMQQSKTPVHEGSDGNFIGYGHTFLKERVRAVINDTECPLESLWLTRGGYRAMINILAADTHASPAEGVRPTVSGDELVDAPVIKDARSAKQPITRVANMAIMVKETTHEDMQELRRRPTVRVRYTYPFGTWNA